MLLFTEKVPTDPSSSGTHSKISQKISFIYVPGAYQIAASDMGLRSSEFVHRPYKKKSFGFLWPSSSSRGKSYFFFSKLDVMGAHLPSAGPQGRGWVASVGLEPLAPQGEPPSCL